MNASIRRATSDDLDAIAPLFDAYRQFYAQPSDLPRAHDFLRQRLARNESVVLIAQHDRDNDRDNDHVAVGFTQLYPMFSSVRTARVWILNDLYVTPDARRGGIARGLLDAAARFAHDDGAARIMLETGRDNAAARALYRAAGWAEDDSQWYGLSLGNPTDRARD